MKRKPAVTAHRIGQGVRFTVSHRPLSAADTLALLRHNGSSPEEAEDLLANALIALAEEQNTEEPG